MTRRTVMGVVAALGAAGMVGVWGGSAPTRARADGIAPPVAPSSVAPPAIGRYHTVPRDPDRVWVTDTTTGHLWSVAANGSWSDCGKPPAE